MHSAMQCKADTRPSQHNGQIVDDGYFCELFEHFLVVIDVDRHEEDAQRVGVTQLGDTSMHVFWMQSMVS